MVSKRGVSKFQPEVAGATQPLGSVLHGTLNHDHSVLEEHCLLVEHIKLPEKLQKNHQKQAQMPVIYLKA